MPVATVRAILIADPAVTALVGDRISPVETAEKIAFPNITLMLNTTAPYDTLLGWAGVDRNEVQIECWAFSYQQALDIARAARQALEAANLVCLSRFSDEFIAEPGTDPGVYKIGFTHQVWTP
jgi:hypothetical protein